MFINFWGVNNKLPPLSLVIVNKTLTFMRPSDNTSYFLVPVFEGYFLEANVKALITKIE